MEERTRTGHTREPLQPPDQQIHHYKVLFHNHEHSSNDKSYGRLNEFHGGYNKSYGCVFRCHMQWYIDAPSCKLNLHPQYSIRSIPLFLIFITNQLTRRVLIADISSFTFLANHKSSVHSIESGLWQCSGSNKGIGMTRVSFVAGDPSLCWNVLFYLGQGSYFSYFLLDLQNFPS